MANMPRGLERRTEMLRIKATETEKRLIEAAAKHTGFSQSDFMRIAIQEALDKYPDLVIAENEAARSNKTT